MGYDQANRAATLWRLGRYDEARAALDEAYSIAAEPEAGFKAQLASVELTGADMAFSLGKRAEATMRATAALKLAERDYKVTALHAKLTLALIKAVSGAAKQAMALVEEAVGTARELSFPGPVDSTARIGRSSHRRRRRTGRARRRAGGTEDVRLGRTARIGVASVAGVG